VTARALLFDMDGTLIDSHAVVERIWHTFAERFDLDPREILAQSHGVRMIETIRRHAPPGTDAEAVARELSAIEILDAEGVAPIGGAGEFLRALPAASVALVTSATSELARVRMELVGIPLPRVVVTAEEVDRGKPAPDCYLLAAERLGIAPGDAVVFEDAEAGIRAGLAAGMRVVVVGGWQSPTTVGLPRVRDYREMVASTHEDGVHLDWKIT
jgi:sugar-phosphatase